MAVNRALLSAYTIRIREKGQSKSHEKLDSFDGNHDFLEELSRFLKKQKQVQEHDAEAQHLMLLEKLEEDERTLSGVIRSGQYGQACEVVNAKKFDVVYHKKIDDADMLPFYFRFEVPADSDEGLFIVQRGSATGGGVKTTLVRRLTGDFEKRYEEYKLDFGPLLPAEVVEGAAKHGTIQKVRFIHFGLPSDIAERYGSGHKEKFGSMELVIKARRNSSLPLKPELLKFFRSKDKKLGEFYELKDVNFDFQEVRVDVKVGRQKRSISLGDLSSSPLYDVSSDVEFSTKDGSATYDSIHEAAGKLAEELKAGIYGNARR
jgi:hypothetical protein